tara:strand:- start:787 stop:1032 length:246 start_codon:yes stop_codon:yes gene_type:complete
MAIAKFHSLRGEKSALILVKANALVFGHSPVYIPRTGLPAGIKEGAEFDIPDGYTLVDIVDFETGEVRVTTDGTPLKQLSY